MGQVSIITDSWKAIYRDIYSSILSEAIARINDIIMGIILTEFYRICHTAVNQTTPIFEEWKI